ncbi:MAG: glucose-6-phosphate dehydrogenase [Syntrophobacteraceae bacterium CG2_30_61_12]|nr:MAG: glucose-6-phosphate dehydrogenase [Syntrophobacteraceae bacterium CG2_30_61_12]
MEPCDLVVFGAQGDLARRKLIPSLYQLEKAELIAPDTSIVGVARRESNTEGYVALVRESLERFMTEPIDRAVWERFAGRLRYARIDLTQPDQYQLLQAQVNQELRETVNYLAVAPDLFGPICQGLATAGLTTERTRVVLEKPIGTDLASSRLINDAVGACFHEGQVYRIDHYLAKETVLNLLALRFANSIFTTNWDHNTIDHVQITVAEEVGIEGRWGYFDQSGQLRDMVQNHLLQILTLVAMEPPVSLDADSIRGEKLKVLKALRPITRDNVDDKSVRGQYTAGFLKGGPVPGYLEEAGGNPRSHTETFAALRVDIDNWRWADVPFYLRTGKRMTSKRSEVVIHFKRLPHNIFRESYRKLPANRLIIQLQPNEGVEIEVLNKVPGLGKGLELQRTMLDLSFSETFKNDRIPDAYERLLLEAMRGNQALFIRRDEVEQAWTWIDSIQNAWRSQNEPPKPYPAGTWGPVASVALLARDGREWDE